MARPTNDRIVAVLFIGWSLFGILWVRCAWLQVLASSRYAAVASLQHQSTQALRARRGTIYDRLGRTLAMSIPAPSIYANARQVDEKFEVARQVADAVGRDEKRIQQRLEQDKGFVWLARQVEPTATSEVFAMHEGGVGIIEEPKRIYPHHQLASHLLGFVNIDAQGLEGLELSLNHVLQGQDGQRSTLRDAKGNVLIGPWTQEVNPIDGDDVTLTIDSVVQQVAEDALEWGMAKYHAKGGSIIVMEPSSGAILALANAPSYDPNMAGQAAPEARRNRAVTDLFEPGSVFKVVTASALLEEGRVNPDEPVFCENGAYHTVAHHILHDHEPHGILPFRDVIKLSSNIGTAKIAQRLNPEELSRYIRAFGFGQRTGVDIPGEVSGIVPPPSRWSKLSPYIIPIGQEVGVTPMQLAVMMSVVANGGLRVQPYLVDRIQKPDGLVVRSHHAQKPVRVISPTIASTMQTILASVVESGTGRLASVQGLTVAGKTGTAQKVEPTGRYSHSRFVASFVGFGPVPDSRFVIVVSMDEPRPLYFGGVVSAPMFKRMVEQLAGYWELPRQTAPNVVAQLP